MICRAQKVFLTWYGRLLARHPLRILVGTGLAMVGLGLWGLLGTKLPSFADPTEGFQTRSTEISDRSITYSNFKELVNQRKHFIRFPAHETLRRQHEDASLSRTRRSLVSGKLLPSGIAEDDFDWADAVDDGGPEAGRLRANLRKNEYSFCNRRSIEFTFSGLARLVFQTNDLVSAKFLVWLRIFEYLLFQRLEATGFRSDEWFLTTLKGKPCQAWSLGTLSENLAGSNHLLINASDPSALIRDTISLAENNAAHLRRIIRDCGAHKDEIIDCYVNNHQPPISSIGGGIKSNNKGGIRGCKAKFPKDCRQPAVFWLYYYLLDKDFVYETGEISGMVTEREGVDPLMSPNQVQLPPIPGITLILLPFQRSFHLAENITDWSSFLYDVMTDADYIIDKATDWTKDPWILPMSATNGESSVLEKNVLLSVHLVGMDFGVRYELFHHYLLKDVWFGFIAVGLVLLSMWIYTGSLWFTVFALLGIVFSLGLAYWLYRVVLGIEFFPFMNLLSLILAIGVGADDTFILRRVWLNAKMEKYSGTLAKIAGDALRHAALSMFVTSLTTAAAFFTNLLSSVIAVQCFGLFAGITILANYLLVVTWLPAALAFIDKSSPGAPKISCCCCQSNYGNASPYYNNSSSRCKSTSEVQEEAVARKFCKKCCSSDCSKKCCYVAGENESKLYAAKDQKPNIEVLDEKVEDEGLGIYESAREITPDLPSAGQIVESRGTIRVKAVRRNGCCCCFFDKMELGGQDDSMSGGHDDVPTPLSTHPSGKSTSCHCPGSYHTSTTKNVPNRKPSKVAELSLCQWLHKQYTVVSDWGRVVFEKLLPCLVIQLRWLWLLLFGGIALASGLAIFHYPGLKLPDTDNFRLFRRSHPMERWESEFRTRFLFFAQGQNVPMPMRVVWGIDPHPVGLKIFDPQDKGRLYTGHYTVEELRNDQMIGSVVAPAWQLNNSLSLLWLDRFCTRFSMQNFTALYPGDQMLGHCFVHDFFKWMKRPCIDPVSKSSLSPCCANSTFPYSNAIVSKCLWQAAKGFKTTAYTGSVFTGLFFGAGSKDVVALVVEFPSTHNFSFSYPAMRKFYSEISHWLRGELAAAPFAMRKGWFSSLLDFYDLQTALLKGTTTAVLVAISLAFFVLAITTRNILLSFLSILSITAVIFTTIASLILLGWELNVLESTVIILTVGLSFDFTLHYAVAFRLSRADSSSGFCKATRTSSFASKNGGLKSGVKGRDLRICDAIGMVGSPIFMSMSTTFLAGLAMVPATTLAYYQIGVFMMLITSISWLYSTFFFTSLLYFWGPIGRSCELGHLLGCDRGGSVSSISGKDQRRDSQSSRAKTLLLSNSRGGSTEYLDFEAKNIVISAGGRLEAVSDSIHKIGQKGSWNRKREKVHKSGGRFVRHWERGLGGSVGLSSRPPFFGGPQRNTRSGSQSAHPLISPSIEKDLTDRCFWDPTIEQKGQWAEIDPETLVQWSPYSHRRSLSAPISNLNAASQFSGAHYFEKAIGLTLSSNELEAYRTLGFSSLEKGSNVRKILPVKISNTPYYPNKVRKNQQIITTTADICPVSLNSMEENVSLNALGNPRKRSWHQNLKSSLKRASGRLSSSLKRSGDGGSNFGKLNWKDMKGAGCLLDAQTSSTCGVTTAGSPTSYGPPSVSAREIFEDPDSQTLAFIDDDLNGAVDDSNWQYSERFRIITKSTSTTQECPNMEEIDTVATDNDSCASSLPFDESSLINDAAETPILDGGDATFAGEEQSELSANARLVVISEGRGTSRSVGSQLDGISSESDHDRQSLVVLSTDL